MGGTIKIGDKKAFLLEPDKIQPVIYSTEEREIGVWTDRKPLYQKTVVLASSMSITSNTWTDIDNGDWSFVDTFVLGFMVNANGASVGFVAVDKNNTNNKLRILQTRSTDITCKSVTIQYTKTTDTAGSGKWTPQGVPSVHYSTDEQVIGTWIDGSTLYEKTIDFGALPNASVKDVAHNISNVDNIWIHDGFCHSTTSGTVTLPVFYSMYNESSSYTPNGFSMSVNSTNVRALTYTDRSAFNECYITLRYTKSS